MINLPEDLEPFADDYSDISGPGVYALNLSKPRNLAEAWDREFDSRPNYWNELKQARFVVYVGAAKNVLSRLEDHRDGNVRVGVLQRICEIQEVRNVWFCDSTDKAFEMESRKGIELRNWLRKQPVYVHWR